MSASLLPGVLLECCFYIPSTPVLHHPDVLQISLLPIVLHRTGMTRNLQRAFLGTMAEISHLQWLIIVDRDESLFFLDRLNRRIRDIVRQPAMRYQCPAAVIDCQHVLF